MEIFKQIIKNFEDKIEYTKNLIDEKDISVYEEAINAKLGKYLKYYVLHYGYLALDDIEFLGINSKQGLKSDMIETTKTLHENFSKTQNYIAFFKTTDDIYYLVDESDNVYRFDSFVDELKPLNTNLINFIKETFYN